MRTVFGLLVGVVVSLWTGAAAVAESRIALVIGNSAYQNASRLPNPIRDATAVAALFRSAGFDVVDLQTDLGGSELRRAIRNFGARAENADVALVYFAGHGIEVDGGNYLIPVDARLERDLDVEDEALSLERILKVIEPAKRLRLVILDACRDNPFARTMHRTLASRSIGRGLARVEPASLNTLIAFAAKAGSTAADGSGANSPFTAALLKHLLSPGVDLRIAFGLIRDEVLSNTQNRQEPFVYGSLGGAFVSLLPETKVDGPAAAAAPPADPGAQARADYELAERVGTVEAWDYFLAAHPDGFYANLARAQRAKLAAPAPAPPPTTLAAAPPQIAPPVTEPNVAPQPTSIPPLEVARLLQTELKRVGCDPGSTRGEWNDQSRRAMEGFNRHAGAKFDARVASIDALEAVRGIQARVCPLTCGNGMRAEGDQCIRITCEAGYVLGTDGACQKRKERTQEKTKAVAHAKRARGGSRCLSFGGRQICQ